jgi:uncharacterized protein (TIGR02646 family)
MRLFQRLPAPGCLAGRWEAWGIEWQQRKEREPGASFHWHTIDGEAVNHKLLPVLKAQVQNHCSFCDIFPVRPPSKDTIDHFRPKAAFPLLAYQWENLYYCCDYCQEKGTQFDDALLRPDDPEYTFERFFRWDFTTGRIEVNERASLPDQHRARVTIDTFRLNIEHPSLRKRELRHRSALRELPLEEFAYRDFVGDGSVPSQLQNHPEPT